MRRQLHRFIVWYLRRCAGAFHFFPYGPKGRYVVLMNETQYHRYTHLARDYYDEQPLKSPEKSHG